LTEMGKMGAVREIVKLLQCIKSARWPEDYPLSILPGVSEIADEKVAQRLPKDLVTLVTVADMRGGKVLDGTMNLLGIQGSGRAQFTKALAALPDLVVKAGSSGQEGSLTVTLTRRNALQDAEGRIYAPKFPKPQTEGYFVLVAEMERPDEIIALKRANWPSPQQRNGGRQSGYLESTVRIKLEESTVERKISVLVMSDAYPGMEWKVDHVLVPTMQVRTVEVQVNEGLEKR